LGQLFVRFKLVYRFQISGILIHSVGVDVAESADTQALLKGYFAVGDSNTRIGPTTCACTGSSLFNFY